MTPEGIMIVPPGDGLGVDVDRDRIEDLTVRVTELRAG
jgi:L-alanine-DL-glutamate epimerase-like enolase superfamily enzyme